MFCSGICNLCRAPFEWLISALFGSAEAAALGPEGPAFKMVYSHGWWVEACCCVGACGLPLWCLVLLLHRTGGKVLRLSVSGEWGSRALWHRVISTACYWSWKSQRLTHGEERHGFHLWMGEGGMVLEAPEWEMLLKASFKNTLCYTDLNQSLRNCKIIITTNTVVCMTLLHNNCTFPGLMLKRYA